MLLLFFACSEYEFAGKGDASGGDTGERPETGAPGIEVSPSVVDFGLHEVGLPRASEVFTIESVGELELSVDSVELVLHDGAFDLLAVGELTLEPGDSTDVVVTFEPTAGGSFAGLVEVHSDDPDTPTVEVVLVGDAPAPDIEVTPWSHDFGTLDYGDSDSVTLSLANVGDADLVIEELTYSATSDELTLDSSSVTLPLTLAPGASATVDVHYVPVDEGMDEGDLTVLSNDPDTPLVTATQWGTGLLFEGFSTGWYVYDDGIAYETTSNSSYVVDTHGDTDLYWYEPSGAHGMVDSTDVAGDWATLTDYVYTMTGGVTTPMTGPLSFSSSSSLSTYEWATFTYVMCDFYMESTDDPSDYVVQSGAVDDGILVLLNGAALGHVTLGSSANFTLTDANPGEVNTLVVILVDDSASHRYLYDLAFYKDGVLVEGS